MATIPGASGYLNSATLANRQGISASSSTVLGEAEGATSILDIGRSSLFDTGIGLSASARQLNKQFLESTSSTFNSIFSLSLGNNATIEGMQQQILALRAKAPKGGLSREVAGNLETVGSDVIDEAAAAEAAADAEAQEVADRIAENANVTLLSQSGSVVDEDA